MGYSIFNKKASENFGKKTNINYKFFYNLCRKNEILML